MSDYKMDHDIDGSLTRHRNLSMKLRTISPIRKNKHKGVIESCSDINKASGTPLHLTTDSRSLCSSPDFLGPIRIEELEGLRNKIKEIEDRVNQNLNQLEEKIVKNENLAQCIQNIEDRLKDKKNMFCEGVKGVHCGSKCLII